jgi:predicted DNA-binding protein
VEPRNKPANPTSVRLDEETRERLRNAAERFFQGNESILLREAVLTYLDLRDAQGLRFDLVIQPLRERELAAVS